MQGGVPSDIQGIIDSCDKAMSQAEDMCDIIPGQAVIGIAGEQVKGFSTSVTVPRADPNLKINEVELIQTLQLVQKRALREARHAMSLELGVADVSVKLINSAITSVRIDGFVVNNPIDFQGKQMVITVVNTYAPLTHVGAPAGAGRQGARRTGPGCRGAGRGRGDHAPGDGEGGSAPDGDLSGRGRQRPAGGQGAASKLSLGGQTSVRPPPGRQRPAPGRYSRHLRLHRVAARPAGHHADGAGFPRHSAAI